MEKETRPLAQCYASVGLGGGGGDPVASVRTNTRGTEGERSEYKSLSWTGGGGRERRTAEVSRGELLPHHFFFAVDCGICAGFLPPILARGSDMAGRGLISATRQGRKHDVQFELSLF